MKQRLLRAFAAAALGLVVLMPATTQPAYAAGNDAYGDIALDVLAGLFDRMADGSLSATEIVELVRETIAAVDGVKTDVVSRLDTQLVHDIVGSVQTATTSVPYLNDPLLARIYTAQVNQAAHAAKSHVDTVSSDHDLDAVGRAMITLFSLLEVGEARIGQLQPATRFADYRQGLENLVNKMTPHCSEGGLPNANMYWRTCTFNGKTVRADQRGGYNGPEVSINGGPWISGSIDPAAVADMTMSESAEKLAKDVLAELRRRGY